MAPERSILHEAVIRLQEDESGVTNEAIVTAKARCSQVYKPPRTSLSGGLVSGHVFACVLPV